MQKPQTFDRIQIRAVASTEKPGTMHLAIVNPHAQEGEPFILFECFTNNFCSPTLKGMAEILHWMNQEHDKTGAEPKVTMETGDIASVVSAAQKASQVI